MTTFLSGPINIEQGNHASFAVEFFDINGILTVPTAATLSVAYTNTAGSTQTDAVSLTLSNSFYTGVWSSTSAALGLATWSAAATGSTTTGSGQIRILQRQSTL